MTSPQLENGYTRITNDLLDEICKLDLSGNDFKIFFFILRQTYGYQHKEREMSLSYISKGVNILPPHVSRSLKKMSEMNLITIVAAHGIHPQVISIQKDYSKWVLPKMVTVTEIGNTTITKNGNTTITKNGNQINKDNKERLKKEYIVHAPEFFERLWAEYPNKKNKKGISKDAYKEINKAGEALLLKAITNYKEYIAKNAWYSPMNGSTFFNGRWRDYIDNEQSEAKEEKTEKQIQYTADGVMIE